MKSFNLNRLGKKEISFYLAVEEFILNNIVEDTFFLWNLNPSIIIGRHQLLEAEVNFGYAAKKNVMIYRRPSGGGAIYADEGCFMFSFVTKEQKKDEIYSNYLPLITKTLNDLGVNTAFSGRNDLIFDNKKFSGNAVYRIKGGSVLHGTFLYDTDLDELVKMITPDNKKLISKGIKSVSDRVVNLKQYLKLTKDQLMDYLINNIGDYVEELSDEDIEKVYELEKKYKTNNWIYGNNPPYNFFNEERFNWGKISVFINVIKGKIKSLTIKGDFFALKDIEELTNSFIGTAFKREEFIKILANINIKDYIFDSSNADLITVVFGG